ncbi:MAG: hypothetical protein CL677_01740 [Bdellovibrionaceae bacterium]|nr:hypothetical protein [Pseudobdellovibrionaceae bacterium]|tara:strand:- start:7356 stop:8075 length:720 start_codon:yes stop_codon:yes gene_type:complete
MESAPKIKDEEERLSELESYHILDTEEEEIYNSIVKIASYICETPIALISLVDKERQWFKARVGLDATETDRSLAFCAHAIQQEKIFEVSDSRVDERFQDNPLVTASPNIVFYAGAPISTSSGHNLGTLCVIDSKPKQLSKEQQDLLTSLSQQVSQNFELRRAKKELMKANQILEDFSYKLSHDLQTPLRHITAYCELIENKHSNDFDDESTTWFANVSSGAKRMRQHIKEMLTAAGVK